MSTGGPHFSKHRHQMARLRDENQSLTKGPKIPFNIEKKIKILFHPSNIKPLNEFDIKYPKMAHGVKQNFHSGTCGWKNLNYQN